MIGDEKKMTKVVNHKVVNNNAAVWGFPSLVAYIGAAIYFVSITDGAFWAVIGALLKAIVWPAFVVFHVLQLLGA